MPRIDVRKGAISPEEFARGLEMLVDKTGADVDFLTPAEQVTLTIIDTMFPRDKIFRSCLCLFTKEYGKRFSQKDEAGLKELVAGLLLATKAMKVDDEENGKKAN